MNTIALARRVVAERSCYLFRRRKDGTGYDVKPYGAGSKRGWVALDLYSASAIVMVHDGLNETNRARFLAMPLIDMASVAFKVLDSKEGR